MISNSNNVEIDHIVKDIALSVRNPSILSDILKRRLNEEILLASFGECFKELCSSKSTASNMYKCNPGELLKISNTMGSKIGWKCQIIWLQAICNGSIISDFAQSLSEIRTILFDCSSKLRDVKRGNPQYDFNQTLSHHMHTLEDFKIHLIHVIKCCMRSIYYGTCDADHRAPMQNNHSVIAQIRSVAMEFICIVIQCYSMLFTSKEHLQANNSNLYVACESDRLVDVEDIVSKHICQFYEHMVSGVHEEAYGIPLTYSVVPLCSLMRLLHANSRHVGIHSTLLLQTCVSQYIEALSVSGGHLVETQYEAFVELCFQHMDMSVNEYHRVLQCNSTLSASRGQQHAAEVIKGIIQWVHTIRMIFKCESMPCSTRTHVESLVSAVVLKASGRNGSACGGGFGLGFNSDGHDEQAHHIVAWFVYVFESVWLDELKQISSRVESASTREGLKICHRDVQLLLLFERFLNDSGTNDRSVYHICKNSHGNFRDQKVEDIATTTMAKDLYSFMSALSASEGSSGDSGYFEEDLIGLPHILSSKTIDVDVVYQDSVIYIRVCKLITALLMLILLHPKHATSSLSDSKLLQRCIATILGVELIAEDMSGLSVDVEAGLRSAARLGNHDEIWSQCVRAHSLLRVSNTMTCYSAVYKHTALECYFDWKCVTHNVSVSSGYISLLERIYGASALNDSKLLSSRSIGMDLLSDILIWVFQLVPQSQRYILLMLVEGIRLCGDVTASYGNPDKRSEISTDVDHLRANSNHHLASQLHVDLLNRHSAIQYDSQAGVASSIANGACDVKPSSMLSLSIPLIDASISVVSSSWHAFTQEVGLLQNDDLLMSDKEKQYHVAIHASTTYLSTSLIAVCKLHRTWDVQQGDVYDILDNFARELVTRPIYMQSYLCDPVPKSSTSMSMGADGKNCKAAADRTPTTDIFFKNSWSNLTNSSIIDILLSIAEVSANCWSLFVNLVGPFTKCFSQGQVSKTCLGIKIFIRIMSVSREPRIQENALDKLIYVFSMSSLSCRKILYEELLSSLSCSLQKAKNEEHKVISVPNDEKTSMFGVHEQVDMFIGDYSVRSIEQLREHVKLRLKTLFVPERLVDHLNHTSQSQNPKESDLGFVVDADIEEENQFNKLHVCFNSAACMEKASTRGDVRGNGNGNSNASAHNKNRNIHVKLVEDVRSLTSLLVLLDAHVQVSVAMKDTDVDMSLKNNMQNNSVRRICYKILGWKTGEPGPWEGTDGLEGSDETVFRHCYSSHPYLLSLIAFIISGFPYLDTNITITERQSDIDSANPNHLDPQSSGKHLVHRSYFVNNKLLNTSTYNGYMHFATHLASCTNVIFALIDYVRFMQSHVVGQEGAENVLNEEGTKENRELSTLLNGAGLVLYGMLDVLYEVGSNARYSSKYTQEEVEYSLVGYHISYLNDLWCLVPRAMELQQVDFYDGVASSGNNSETDGLDQFRSQTHVEGETLNRSNVDAPTKGHLFPLTSWWRSWELVDRQTLRVMFFHNNLRGMVKYFDVFKLTKEANNTEDPSLQPSFHLDLSPTVALGVISQICLDIRKHIELLLVARQSINKLEMRSTVNAWMNLLVEILSLYKTYLCVDESNTWCWLSSAVAEFHFNVHNETEFGLDGSDTDDVDDRNAAQCGNSGVAASKEKDSSSRNLCFMESSRDIERSRNTSKILSEASDGLIEQCIGSDTMPLAFQQQLHERNDIRSCAKHVVDYDNLGSQMELTTTYILINCRRELLHCISAIVHYVRELIKQHEHVCPMDMSSNTLEELCVDTSQYLIEELLTHFALQIATINVVKVYLSTIDILLFADESSQIPSHKSQRSNACHFSMHVQTVKDEVASGIVRILRKYPLKQLYLCQYLLNMLLYTRSGSMYDKALLCTDLLRQLILTNGGNANSGLLSKQFNKTVAEGFYSNHVMMDSSISRNRIFYKYFDIHTGGVVCLGDIACIPPLTSNTNQVAATCTATVSSCATPLSPLVVAGLIKRLMTIVAQLKSKVLYSIGNSGDVWVIGKGLNGTGDPHAIDETTTSAVVNNSWQNRVLIPLVDLNTFSLFKLVFSIFVGTVVSNSVSVTETKAYIGPEVEMEKYHVSSSSDEVSSILPHADPNILCSHMDSRSVVLWLKKFIVPLINKLITDCNTVIKLFTNSDLCKAQVVDAAGVDCKRGVGTNLMEQSNKKWRSGHDDFVTVGDEATARDGYAFVSESEGSVGSISGEDHSTSKSKSSSKAKPAHVLRSAKQTIRVKHVDEVSYASDLELDLGDTSEDAFDEEDVEHSPSLYSASDSSMSDAYDREAYDSDEEYRVGRQRRVTHRRRPNRGQTKHAETRKAKGKKQRARHREKDAVKDTRNEIKKCRANTSGIPVVPEPICVTLGVVETTLSNTNSETTSFLNSPQSGSEPQLSEMKSESVEETPLPVLLLSFLCSISPVTLKAVVLLLLHSEEGEGTRNDIKPKAATGLRNLKPIDYESESDAGVGLDDESSGRDVRESNKNFTSSMHSEPLQINAQVALRYLSRFEILLRKIQIIMDLTNFLEDYKQYRKVQGDSALNRPQQTISGDRKEQAVRDRDGDVLENISTSESLSMAVDPAALPSGDERDVNANAMSSLFQGVTIHVTPRLEETLCFIKEKGSLLLETFKIDEERCVHEVNTGSSAYSSIRKYLQAKVSGSLALKAPYGLPKAYTCTGGIPLAPGVSMSDTTAATKVTSIMGGFTPVYQQYRQMKANIIPYKSNIDARNHSIRRRASTHSQREFTSYSRNPVINEWLRNDAQYQKKRKRQNDAASVGSDDEDAFVDLEDFIAGDDEFL